MTTTQTERLRALRETDEAMRAAFAAFEEAVGRRTEAAAALGARVGKINLGSNWPEYALLKHLRDRIAELPSGVRLDEAAGRAVLARDAQAAAAARRQEARAAQAAQTRAASERILADVNRSVEAGSAERARALAALEAAQ